MPETRHAILYRMVMPQHICPWGLKSKWFLEREGYAVDDRWIADWNRTQAVNLLAAGVLCRSAIAHFAANGGGRIVNIASRAGHRGDTPDYFAYAAVPTFSEVAVEPAVKGTAVAATPPLPFAVAPLTVFSKFICCEPAASAS